MFCSSGLLCKIIEFLQVFAFLTGDYFPKIVHATSRRHERPRSSRSQHSNPGGASCRCSASVAQIIAAAMICATDALERQLAPPGFECCKRELLGRSWRRDWGMRNFPGFWRLRQSLRRAPKKHFGRSGFESAIGKDRLHMPRASKGHFFLHPANF